jgi:hypothetical protein
MARFTITATVSVDIEVSVEAETADAARKLLDDHLVMGAAFVDLPDDATDVSEDSISSIDGVKIRREAA